MRFLPDCSNVLKLYEIYEEPSKIYMVLEMMNGDDLCKMMKKKKISSESEIYEIFSHILDGLVFLHKHHIMHRDLKPDNILFSSSNNHTTVKISDFTLAINFENNKNIKLKCGTPGFMAPEIFSGEHYDERVDIYSLGIILYIL